MILQSLTLPDGTIVKSPTDFTSVGDIFTKALPYILTIAGLILLFVIIGAGFTMFTSAGNPEKIKKSSQQLTFGIIGFVVIFTSYWIIQLLEKVFGLSILGL